MKNFAWLRPGLGKDDTRAKGFSLNDGSQPEGLAFAKGFSSIAVLIVLVAVVLGLVAVLAFANMNLKKEPAKTEQNVEDPQVQTLNSLSESDEVSAIEQDINATNLESIDQGVEEIDRETSGL